MPFNQLEMVALRTTVCSQVPPQHPHVWCEKGPALREPVKSQDGVIDRGEQGTWVTQVIWVTSVSWVMQRSETHKAWPQRTASERGGHGHGDAVSRADETALVFWVCFYCKRENPGLGIWGFYPILPQCVWLWFSFFLRKVSVVQLRTTVGM